jgi:NAD(P)H-hydrate repair Nnr-like enzyme with NAD(P)H-hydrate epimerase domain
VAAGPGNNGGDALVAALLLMQEGYSVDILLPQMPASPQKHSKPIWPCAGRWHSATAACSRLPPPALLIDGLFGIGLNRPLDSKWLTLIHQLNQLDCPAWHWTAPAA